MSSTNKTTNYELSQFIGTDKPAWLTDYNADMSKIDAGVAAAQTTATGADGKATANTTAIGTLANLTTTAKTNLVAAINEVDTNADAAAGVAADAATSANTAYTTATGAAQQVAALADYLTITAAAVATNKLVPRAGTLSDAGVSVAQNSTHSLGKVYGYFNLTPATSGWQQVTINYDTGIHPDSSFDISCAGLSNGNNEITLRFNTDGTIQIIWYAPNTNNCHVVLFPCLYFFVDFGDVAPTA